MRMIFLASSFYLIRVTYPMSTVCLHNYFFAGGVNKEVPCVRDDVRLAYSADRGRYLVATQDIPPGMKFKS